MLCLVALLIHFHSSRSGPPQTSNTRGENITPQDDLSQLRSEAFSTRLTADPADVLLLYIHIYIYKSSQLIGYDDGGNRDPRQIRAVGRRLTALRNKY